MRRPRPRRVLLATAAVVSLLGTSGCATLVIGARRARWSRPHGRRGGELVIVGSDGGAVDEQARSALADLETFWTEQFPEVYGQEFQPLQGGYFSVDPDASTRASTRRAWAAAWSWARPPATPSTARPRSANSDAITYDRAFLAELADDYGRFLPALVMAHEFGHAVQGRVGMPGSSIATETQADCMAGAWSAWVAGGASEHSQLREPELDEVLSGYFLLRDPVGTSTAEESAHGSYFDRVSGFQDGFDGGPETCRDEFGPDRLFTQGDVPGRRRRSGRRQHHLFEPDRHRRVVPARLGRGLPDGLRRGLPGTGARAVRRRGPGLRARPRPRSRPVPGRGRRGLRRAGPDRAGLRARRLRRRTAIAIPYSLAAREQLGLSTDDEEAVRSALCLTGWYAAKVYNEEAGDKVLISPGDIDESVQFLLDLRQGPERAAGRRPDRVPAGRRVPRRVRPRAPGLRGRRLRSAQKSAAVSCRRAAPTRGSSSPTTANSSTRCLRAGSRSSPAERRTTSSSRSKAASTLPVPSRKSAARVWAATSSGAASARGQRRRARPPRPGGTAAPGAAPARPPGGRARRRGSPGRPPRPRPGRRARAPPRRRRGAGPRRPRPRRLPASPPGTAPPVVAFTSSVMNCRGCSSGMAPLNSATSWPCHTAFTAGMPCTRRPWASARVGVDVDLGQHPRAAALRGEPLEHRRQLLARPAPLGPEVEDHRHLERPVQHLGLEGRLGDVDDGRARRALRGGRARRRRGLRRAAASERAFTAARSTAPAIAAAIWACWACARGSGRPGRVGCMGPHLPVLTFPQNDTAVGAVTIRPSSPAGEVDHLLEGRAVLPVDRPDTDHAGGVGADVVLGLS